MNGLAEIFVQRARGVERWLMREVDPRAYACVRISVALSGLALFADLWPLRLALLSEVGNLGAATRSDALRINLFQWVSSPAAVTAMFVFAGLGCLCLLVGVLPRVSAWVVYLWITSYSAAASLALGGFDTVARLTSFALAVSPTVTTWSLAKTAEPQQAVPRYGLRMLQWQLVIIYWVTVWLKAPDKFWRQGEVISSFMMSMFARFPHPVFAELGGWDQVFTWGTLLIEFLVPLLLWRANTRWWGMLLGLGLHVCIAIIGKLSLFAIVMLPLYVAFLERRDFERLQRCVQRLAPGIAARAGKS